MHPSTISTNWMLHWIRSMNSTHQQISFLAGTLICAESTGKTCLIPHLYQTKRRVIYYSLSHWITPSTSSTTSPPGRTAFSSWHSPLVLSLWPAVQPALESATTTTSFYSEQTSEPSRTRRNTEPSTCSRKPTGSPWNGFWRPQQTHSSRITQTQIRWR